MDRSRERLTHANEAIRILQSDQPLKLDLEDLIMGEIDQFQSILTSHCNLLKFFRVV